MTEAIVQNQQAIAQTKPLSVLDLLDRLLGKGVAASGDIVLSVADIDLVCLNLKLLLSSAETVEQASLKYNGSHPKSYLGIRRESAGRRRVIDSTYNSAPESDLPPIAGGSEDLPSIGGGSQELLPLQTPLPEKPRDKKLNFDPEKTEKGLTKLVLTLVELLRKLMERQAIRRMEGGLLTEEEIERMGQAFSQLELRMEELKKAFGLEGEDLNLNLGPLGDLI